MHNYSLYHIVSNNLLFNAIVTRMNNYIIIITIIVAETRQHSVGWL